MSGTANEGGGRGEEPRGAPGVTGTRSRILCCFGKDAVARDEWPSFLRVNEYERRSGASKRKRAIG